MSTALLSPETPWRWSSSTWAAQDAVIQQILERAARNHDERCERCEIDVRTLLERRHLGCGTYRATVHGPPRRATTAVLAVVAVLLSGCSEGSPVTRDDGADTGLGVSPGLTRFVEADRQAAPAVEGAPVSGDGTVSISHPGRVVVVNVWQSTCGPCRGEADALEAAARATRKEATFVGLDVIDQRAAARAFLRTSKSSYPHIFDPDGEQLLKFDGTLPVQAIPSTAIIDQKGRVAARVIGPVSAQTLTQLIEEVASPT